MIDCIVNFGETVFRNRTHPLEVWNEDEITRTVSFPQEEVLRLTDELIEDIG